MKDHQLIWDLAGNVGGGRVNVLAVPTESEVQIRKRKLFREERSVTGSSPDLDPKGPGLAPAARYFSGRAAVPVRRTAGWRNALTAATLSQNPIAGPVRLPTHWTVGLLAPRSIHQQAGYGLSESKLLNGTRPRLQLASSEGVCAATHQAWSSTVALPNPSISRLGLTSKLQQALGDSASAVPGKS